MKPAIEVVWRFLQDNVFPILDTLVNVYIAAAKLELAALGLVWTNVLKPAIEGWAGEPEQERARARAWRRGLPV